MASFCPGCASSPINALRSVWLIWVWYGSAPGLAASVLKCSTRSWSRVIVMRTFIGRPAASRNAGKGPRRLTFSLSSSYSFLINLRLLARRPPCRDDPDCLFTKGVDDQQQSVVLRVCNQDLPIFVLAVVRVGKGHLEGIVETGRRFLESDAVPALIAGGLVLVPFQPHRVCIACTGRSGQVGVRYPEVR